MEVLRKKIVILNLDDIAGTASGKEQAEDVTDFRMKRDILDRLASMKGLVRVVVKHDKNEKEYMPQLKAIEFFVFCYCKAAVSTTKTCKELMDSLPHNIRKKDYIISLDNEIAEDLDVDYINREGFICTQS